MLVALFNAVKVESVPLNFKNYESIFHDGSHRFSAAAAPGAGCFPPVEAAAVSLAVRVAPAGGRGRTVRVVDPAAEGLRRGRGAHPGGDLRCPAPRRAHQDRLAETGTGGGGGEGHRKAFPHKIL